MSNPYLAFIRSTVFFVMFGVVIASTASYGANWMSAKQMIEIMNSKGIACKILLKIYFNKNNSTPYASLIEGESTGNEFYSTILLLLVLKNKDKQRTVYLYLQMSNFFNRIASTYPRMCKQVLDPLLRCL